MRTPSFAAVLAYGQVIMVVAGCGARTPIADEGIVEESTDAGVLLLC